MKKIRLAAVSSRPIPHQVPLWRLLAKEENIDLKVFFATDAGVKPVVVKHFDFAFAWDTDLTSGYEAEYLVNKPLEKKKFYQYNCPEIAGLLRDGKFDALLMVGREYSFYMQAFREAVRMGIPVLFRAETTKPKKNRVSEYISRFHRKAFYKKVAAMLCIGVTQFDYYGSFGFPADRMFFSPYCVDNAFFQTAANESRPGREGFRKQLGLGAETKTILYVGKLMDKKRPMDLLKAYHKLSKKGDWAVIYIGEGKWRPAMEEYIAEHGLKKAILAGFKNQTELAPYYTAADCFVLPSTHGETWGLVVNEALNFGLPVVLSDQVGCAFDLAMSGENGYRYPMGDADALAEALEKVFANEDKRKRICEYSLKHAAKYAPEVARDGVMEALAAIVPCWK